MKAGRRLGALSLGILLLAGGCRTASYYGQAVRGQIDILRRQRPIERVLADPSTEDSLRRRLQLVQSLRQFATEHLDLPAGSHYSRYADLGRRFVVWNVEAAPEFSLTPRQWWYPVVGSLSYRGFFHEASARRLVERLQRQGFDTAVGPVEAYSTLGWFSDPVLNTWLHGPDADIAETIFHELTHQRLFVAGDTDFNEALATSVATHGVRRWLRSTGSTNALAAYENALIQRREFSRLVEATRSELAQLYAPLPPAWKQPGAATVVPADQLAGLRQRKQAIFESMRSRYASLTNDWNGQDPFGPWFRQPLGNASLNGVSTYDRWVPAFDSLLADAQGSLRTFFIRVRDLGRLPAAERRLELERRSPPHPTPPHGRPPDAQRPPPRTERLSDAPSSDGPPAPDPLRPGATTGSGSRP